ncbi:Zinc finger and SCAN domain-containing protein 29 [Chelonia mydas]|uniref:Zinc finger and SCAN domain-containing protein 29 n=1 Tax=Chelonia mydas TaxID=8469 RepID=M7CIJ0_CHEMY|nr:Zinc finger and SCAN domain-containing protein 29 [Chelonia mydas]
MPPRTRRSPVWSNGEVLDLISVWGEEAVWSQLRSSRRNYDIFGQISRDMMERGYDQDTLQCRVKVKELWNAYRKAHKANSHSGAAPVICCFYKELDAILGGDPTSTPSTTMDTSEPSATSAVDDKLSRWHNALLSTSVLQLPEKHKVQCRIRCSSLLDMAYILKTIVLPPDTTRKCPMKLSRRR